MSERPPHGSVNGNYRLLSSLGLGGYAEVFQAEHRERPGEIVAFKRPRLVALAAERMAREIDVQRRFTHPNVMPILENGPELWVRQRDWQPARLRRSFDLDGWVGLEQAATNEPAAQ